MPARPRALVYSERLTGHRQLYCDVLTDVLLELGYHVVLAVGLTADRQSGPFHAIERYCDCPHVEIFDLGHVGGLHRSKLTAAEIVTLQRQKAVALSLFTCGDELQQEFIDVALGQAPALCGRTIAIVGGTTAWYPTEAGVSAPPLTLRQRWRRFHTHLRYPRVRERDRRADPRFFFERVLGGGVVVERVLVKDERFAEAKGIPFVWLPEIYKSFKQDDTAGLEAEYQAVVPLYREFLDGQQGREPLLYFGRAEGFKGYDTLLLLALADQSTCFVHCGERNDEYPFEMDVREARDLLARQGRIFETNRYIIGERTIDVFFASIRRFVSTHRPTGSSGTVLRALAAGKPTLVPGSGQLRYRTETYGLGRTYKPGDVAGLLTAWREFKAQPPEQFQPAIADFMGRFERERLVAALTSAGA